MNRPGFLPVFFLDDFAFVRRRGAEIRIGIDGHQRSPQTLTRLVQGPASYFTRYSTRVVLAHWNKRWAAVMEPASLDLGAKVVEAGGLEWHNEVPGVVAGEYQVAREEELFSPSGPGNLPWQDLRGCPSTAMRR